jgi:hypothetical protein
MASRKSITHNHHTPSTHPARHNAHTLNNSDFPTDSPETLQPSDIPRNYRGLCRSDRRHFGYKAKAADLPVPHYSAFSYRNPGLKPGFPVSAQHCRIRAAHWPQRVVLWCDPACHQDSEGIPLRGLSYLRDVHGGESVRRCWPDSICRVLLMDVDQRDGVCSRNVLLLWTCSSLGKFIMK